MLHTPERCPFRAPAFASGGAAVMTCRLVGEIVGVDDPEVLRVERDACEACCRALPAPIDRSLNLILVSVVFAAATRVVERGGVAGCDADKARRVRDWAVDHLPLALPECPEPDPGREDDRARSPAPRSARSWAVGLITAPRSSPTLARTLLGLERAGFDRVHIFAEPGVTIPDEFRHLPVTQHHQRLGNFGNFYTALTTLSKSDPLADCVALFQDDIEPAEDLKAWCERTLWPGGAGLVSLYTPRVFQDKQVGWRTLSMGFYRTFGGLAFLFRRDVLVRFLADPFPRRIHERIPHCGDDAVVGAWAQSTGIGITYHTPSLVRHIGEHSSIAGHGNGRHGRSDAVTTVRGISSWTPPPPQPGKVGLVGWNTATGLGSMNRDLAWHGAVDRWLVPEHGCFPTLEDPPSACRIEHVPRSVGGDDLRAWMHGLDWVLFIEIPYVRRFAQHARGLGISVAFVPMWEMSHPQAEWLRYVDLVLCPTDRTFRVFSDWRRQYGFTWDIALIPWPVDVHRFSFRLRTTCRRFVFINGTGGCRGMRPDGTLTPYRRKGIELVFEAARRAPDLSFLAYTQTDEIPPVPPNVELRDASERNERLYDEGQVCVLPSHWEGLGLPLLECQAAGMPLVTTDAAPMNEYQPLATVPVARTETISIYRNYPLAAQLPDPDELVRILRSLVGTDVREASRAARSFVERRHSWEAAGPLIRERLIQ